MADKQPKALRQKRQTHQTLEIPTDFFELSFDLMAIVDEDGNFKRVNPAFEKTLGWTIAELSSSLFSDLMHPDDRVMGRAELEKLAGDTTTTQFQNRYRCQDGEYKWLLWKVQTTSNGWLYLVARDITRQMKAEQALRLATELQQAILNNIEYSIISTTPEGIIQTFNQAAERMLGYQAEEIVGKESLALIHDLSEIVERAKIFSQELGLEIEPGFDVFIAMARYNLPHQSEWIYIRKDNSRLPVQVSMTAFYDPDGSITGFLCIAHDITEQKAAETILAKQAQELATVAEISTSISTLTEPQRMLQAVADLTKERFDLYHVHIYLLDDSEETLILTAGSGEVGRQMVASDWRIPLEKEHSLIAQAACARQGVMANNLRDREALSHPFLYNTRSELSVPIILGEKLLGVLDAQADSFNRFTVEDMRAHTTLAAHVAVALQNARLFERSEQAIQELNVLTRRLIRAGWDEYLEATGADELGYVYDRKQLLPIGAKDGQGDGMLPISKKSEIEQPLNVQGEIIGLLKMANPQLFTGEAAEIVGSVVEHLSAHLENLRLSEQTQAALIEVQQSQELLRTVIDATPDWIFIKDREHRYRLVNQGYADSLRMAVEDFIGKNDLELGFPKDIVKGNPEKGIRGFWPDDTEVMASGKLKVIEMEPVVVDDQRRYLSTIKAPVRDAEGKVWGVLGYVRDITEREHLLAEVQRLAAIVENHPDFIGVGTLAGQALYINPAGLKMMGLPPDYDVTTMQASDFYPAPDAERLIKEGVPTALERGAWSVETNLLKADGATIPVEETIGINYDAGGDPYSFSITMRDITERKETEAELRKLSRAVEQSPNIVVITDKHGVIEYVNPKFTEVTGYTAQEALGQNPRILKSGEVSSTKYAELWRAITAGEVWRGELINRKKSGDLYWAFLSISPVTNAIGQITHFIAFQEDITERKQAEIERERLLAEVQEMYHRYVRQEWGQLLKERHQGKWHIEHQRTTLSQTQTPEQDYGASLAVPISILGQVIGTLNLQDLDPNRDWTAEERALVETVSEQLGLTIENLRLFEDTRRNAWRDRVVSESTAEIWSSAEIETVLKAAVAQLGDKLQASEVVIRLDQEDGLVE